MKYSNKHSLQASIPESYEINTYGRSSDLLPVILPSHSVQKSGLDLNTVIELTAAGQLRIYTVFPFNPGKEYREPKAWQMYLIIPK